MSTPSTCIRRLTDPTSAFSLVDTDDDVRAVAAACLLPVAETLSEKLSSADLERLLRALWDTFLDDCDELNSSVASVMELLGMSRMFQLIGDFREIHRMFTGRLLATPNVVSLYAEKPAGVYVLTLYYTLQRK